MWPREGLGLDGQRHRERQNERGTQGDEVGLRMETNKAVIV